MCMMTKTISILASALALTACSNSQVLTGTPECAQIGCSTGGLVVYPHEAWGATEQPRRWYGWDWGTSSSAYPVGSPEYQQLRAQECARARTHGLDCQGRSLFKE